MNDTGVPTEIEQCEKAHNPTTKKDISFVMVNGVLKVECLCANFLGHHLRPPSVEEEVIAQKIRDEQARIHHGENAYKKDVQCFGKMLS